MSSNVTEKRPAVKLTVGAQYICFDTPDSNGAWTSTFETAVTKLPTVTQVQITDNADTYDDYASGAVYDSDTDVPTKDIQVTNLAFPDTLLAKMKGDTVSGGVIVEGKVGASRPWFAYGIVVMKKGGELDLRWYPKCKLVESTDSTQTSGESHNSQTDDITIRAYRMSDSTGICVRVDTSDSSTNGITEAAYFEAPILTQAAAEALQPSGGNL